MASLRARVDAGIRTPWGSSAALAAGLLGACVGAGIAEAIARAVPLPMAGLEAARAAGVWSQTSYAGYPKSAELSFLVLGLALSAASGLAAACAAALWCGPGDAPARGEASPHPLRRVRGPEWLVVAALLVYGMQPTPLWAPGRLYLILAEEGAHLLALTTISHGGRLFDQLDYLYGPLLLAPLLPAFAIEPSVYAIRIATLVLHGMGLALLLALARPLFRTPVGWAVLAAGLAWLVPLPQPRLHLTAWRTALAFAPFLFLPRALAGGRGGWLGVGAGSAAATWVGVDLLTASLLGPLVALLVATPRRLPAAAELAAGLVGGLAAGALLFLPIADPRGWLAGAVDTLGAVRLGYLSRVFPEPWGASRLWLGDPFGVGFDVSRYVVAGNAVVGVAVACLAVAAFALLRRPATPRDALRLAFCVSAVLLLPKLVSRPGNYQFTKVMPGILIGATALAETGVLAFRRSPRAATLLPALAGGAALAILAASSSVRAGIPVSPPRYPTYDARLGPIPLHPKMAELMLGVRDAVDRRLPAGEAVWAGPAAPGWNFLLDRPPANPLSIAYVTTTSRDRERVRERLLAEPPKLILRQRDRPSFEGVPMRDFLGVAADAIDERYEVVERLRAGEHVVELLEPR